MFIHDWRCLESVHMNKLIIPVHKSPDDSNQKTPIVMNDDFLIGGCTCLERARRSDQRFHSSEDPRNLWHNPMWSPTCRVISHQRSKIFCSLLQHPGSFANDISCLEEFMLLTRSKSDTRCWPGTSHCKHSPPTPTPSGRSINFLR